MWIYRDFLNKFNELANLESLLVLGPRQVGKTSLLLKMQPEPGLSIFMDDLQSRKLAKTDPSFLFGENPGCVFIDEVHLETDLFFEIKKRIDQKRREKLLSDSKAPVRKSIMFKMTGSNLVQLDSAIKETLAGRVSIYFLLGLSLSEIESEFKDLDLNLIMYKGGFPELYVSAELNPISYLNDYIRTFIEKDISKSAGVEKVDEFLQSLSLFAAHTAQIVNFENMSNAIGIKGKTLKEWFGILKKNLLTYSLPVYSSNLTKRLTKSPKIYFLDTGLAARLQGHQDSLSMKNSVQMGSLFENFVLTEIIKYKLNFQKEFHLSYYRTKEQEEIDFVLQYRDQIVLIEVKLGSQNVDPVVLSSTALKLFKAAPILVVTYGGEIQAVANNQIQVPIRKLDQFLKKYF